MKQVGCSLVLHVCVCHSLKYQLQPAPSSLMVRWDIWINF